MRGMKEWLRETRMRLWVWWRASEVSPDPAYLRREALLDKVLWLQRELDQARAENAVLAAKLAHDDYLLGRPSAWTEADDEAAIGSGADVGVDDGERRSEGFDDGRLDVLGA